MVLTDIKLVTGEVQNITFKDFCYNSDRASGVLKIQFSRLENIEVNESNIILSFSSSIDAYKTDDTKNTSEENKAFTLKIDFTLIYVGNFDLKSLKENIIDNEWFFKKDGSVFLTRAISNILSVTSYKNIEMPYQQ